MYVIYQLCCFGIFKISVTFSFPLSFYSAVVNVFSTKSPHLKTACYLRGLVTVLFLFLTQALLSVLGNVFLLAKKMINYMNIFVYIE